MPSAKASLKSLVLLLGLGLVQPALAQETPAPAATATEQAGGAVLMEAPRAGDAGVVRSDGQVRWSTGTDEAGLPTLIAHVEIPGRKLTLDLVISKNSLTSLEATHVFDIKFSEGYGFTEGSVAGLPGVLLKSERDAQGIPLKGVSSRIVDNQFLFALHADPAVAGPNIEALRTQTWLDVALIYATGRQAILTIEKNAETNVLFATALAAWGE